VQLLQGRHLQFERHPVAPLADLEQALLGAGDELHEAAPGVDVADELGACLFGLGEERIVWTFERRTDHSAAGVDGHDGAARH
jgi:hypothetical protein